MGCSSHFRRPPTPGEPELDDARITRADIDHTDGRISHVDFTGTRAAGDSGITAATSRGWTENDVALDRTDPEGAIAAAVQLYRNWGRWGADDVLGTVNFIDEAKRRQAAALVTRGAT